MKENIVFCRPDLKREKQTKEERQSIIIESAVLSRLAVYAVLLKREAIFSLDMRMKSFPGNSGPGSPKSTLCSSYFSSLWELSVQNVDARMEIPFLK